jgi:glycosyltransferase involved in cell wall biosynthesis
VILAMIGWPADEAAGPIHSLTAISDLLADEFEMKFVARDLPHGQQDRRKNGRGWTRKGQHQIYWCRMSRFGPEGFRALLCSTHHDILLLNSIFDREFTTPALLMRRFGLIPPKPTLVSPRGELAGGALGLKSRRKRAHLALARMLGLYSDVWLHATCAEELEDIQRRVPWSRGALFAPNVRTLPDLPLQHECVRANGGVVRLAFLGRISRVKNLDYALDVLSSVRVPVAFDIYGPVSDHDYWSECQRIIARLPPSVSVSQKGEIPSSSVPGTLARYDLLFLPTRGENFGHAIFEALASGLPALISDRTPWKSLEQRGAGWSLPLAVPQRFATAIDSLSRMSDEERSRLRYGARRAAVEMIAESNAISRTREMFHVLLGHREPEIFEQMRGHEVVS